MSRFNSTIRGRIEAKNFTKIRFAKGIVQCIIKVAKEGDDTEDIPESYVIFITENDVMKGNQPIYPVERYVTIGENKVLFDDGSHILYVNGKYRGNDEVGKLMHDFFVH